MNKVIIYPEDDGALAIVVPVDRSMTIVEVAERTVPEGKPYQIIDSSDLPENREFRDAWEYRPQQGPKEK